MDYEAFSKMLHIQKHRLDDELEVQSDILQQIGEGAATMTAREAQAKEDLDQLEAELFLELYKKGGGTTKEQAQASIQLDPDRNRLWKKWQSSKTEKERWSKLYDSWKARGFDLKSLGQLYTDQYFTVDSAGYVEPRRDSGQREHQRLRQQSAQQRSGSSRRQLD